MHRALPLTVLSFHVLCSSLGAQDEAAPKLDGINAIVHAVATEQIRAFNEEDAAAYAAIFTEDGEWQDDSSLAINGRAAIAKAMAESMAAEKGRKLAVEIAQVRRISPDVLSAKGVTTVSHPNGGHTSKAFTALHVQRNGKWLISDYTESPAPASLTPADALAPLDWLAGTWEQKLDSGTIRCTAEWGPNKRFLTRTTRIQAPPEPDVVTTEHIGWDPALGVVRSWVFDSDGGLTENVWQSTTTGWSIASVSTLPDGLPATAEIEVTKTDDNSMTVASKKRTVAGEPLPDLSTQKLQRKAAQAPKAP